MNQDELDQFPIMSRAITSCAEATDQFQILQIVKHFARDFTFGVEHTTHDHGMVGIFMLKSDNLKEEKRISVSNWSAEFVQERAKLNGYTHDPTIIMVTQANQPFTWDRGFEGADKIGMSISDLCEEHTGQRNGLMFPIADINMLKGAGSIGLDLNPNDLSPNQIGMIHHVFIAAYARLYRLGGPFEEDMEQSFSPKQREIVRLLALGYNLTSAAVVLGCTRRTAKYHAEMAMEKVGARTQAQLVAKSIRKVPLT